MFKIILIFTFLLFNHPFAFGGQPYGQYNQNYTYNSNIQYGATNWYSSPLGFGAAEIGTTLARGIINKLTQPDPVIIYPAQYNGYNPSTYIPNGTVIYPSENRCHVEALYDISGSVHNVNFCD